MSTDRLSEIEERLAAATEPLPEGARMDGYYIGFDRTGPAAVDAILSAVAVAGKGSHNTDGWNDDGGSWYYSASEHLPDADCANDLIQKTAERSAAQVTTMAADLAALVKFAREVEALHHREDDVDGHGKPYATCSRCLSILGEHVDWPCPTAAAVQRIGGA